jgi:hypothetical protein
MPVQRPTWHVKDATGVDPAQIATTKAESFRGGEVAIPTVHRAASPLPDESSVLKGGCPVQPVTQDAVKTRRIHPAFAFRTVQPQIVEAASTPRAKTWRAHPALALRTAQPTNAVVDLALTINQSSEIADSAPPATRPPRGLHLPQSASGKVATRSPLSINPSAPPKPADELIRERSISHKEKAAENVPVVSMPGPSCIPTP